MLHCEQQPEMHKDMGLSCAYLNNFFLKHVSLLTGWKSDLSECGNLSDEADKHKQVTHQSCVSRYVRVREKVPGTVTKGEFTVCVVA